MMNWVWEPSIVLGLLAITGWFELSIGPVQRRTGWGQSVTKWQRFAFHSGTFAVFLALASPLDPLADQALFSAHMIQHMLLTFVGPLLWVVSVPGWLVDKLLPFNFMKKGFSALTRPISAFLIFNGVMWFWHIPALYDAALQNEALHIFEHLAFMGSAVIGWWPVFGRYGQRHGMVEKLVYLVASMFACTALSAIIALSPRLLYSFYGDSPIQFGLTALTDQQIGGAIMWLPGDMIYMVIIAMSFYQMLQTDTQQLQRIAT
ncbi:MAG: cytochrome c oxidase assembly protein [Anaerolineae bacterium]|nr:cytochrome c oxidase assembly protein [Anaerolineae bacterium]